MKHYVAHEQIGVFCYHIPMEVDFRLNYCPFGQCGVKWNREKKSYDLYSYSSMIARFTPATGFLEWGFDALPDYSRTTTKHFSAFCKEYCPSYSYQHWKFDHYKGGAVGTSV